MVAPAGPLSVTPAPLQIIPSLAVPDVSLAVTVGTVGLAFTVTDVVAVVVQELASVTVTSYAPLMAVVEDARVAGLPVAVHAPPALLDHEYVYVAVPPLGVELTLMVAPAQ